MVTIKYQIEILLVNSSNNIAILGSKRLCGCGGEGMETRSWGVKEGDTYHGGERMEGGSQSHSPHYHCLHYAETDPLMDHTRGSNVSHQVRITPGE